MRDYQPIDSWYHCFAVLKSCHVSGIVHQPVPFIPVMLSCNTVQVPTSNLEAISSFEIRDALCSLSVLPHSGFWNFNRCCGLIFPFLMVRLEEYIARTEKRDEMGAHLEKAIAITWSIICHQVRDDVFYMNTKQNRSLPHPKLLSKVLPHASGQ